LVHSTAEKSSRSVLRHVGKSVALQPSFTLGQSPEMAPFDYAISPQPSSLSSIDDQSRALTARSDARKTGNWQLYQTCPFVQFRPNNFRANLKSRYEPPQPAQIIAPLEKTKCVKMSNRTSQKLRHSILAPPLPESRPPMTSSLPFALARTRADKETIELLSTAADFAPKQSDTPSYVRNGLNP
jgi:hypothetical protein